MAINFDKWPRNDTPADGPRPIPYLDLSVEDEPIDFIFSRDSGAHGIMARANLHTLKGKEKTGKSAAGIALITAAISGSFAGITPSREDLDILWIDTEQDRNTLRQKAKAVLSMAGVDDMPERVKIVTLRGYGGPEEMLAATMKAIADNSPDFVFLDGVVDLCQTFNDEEKSRAVVRSLEALAEQYQAAILGLIHTNKGRGNNEPRGHLGAVLQQKSAEIYLVTKEGSTAKVTQDFSRFAPVPPFSFDFTEDFKIKPEAASIEKDKTLKYIDLFFPLFEKTKRIQSKDLAELYKEYHGTSLKTARNNIDAAVRYHALEKVIEGKFVFYSPAFRTWAEDSEDENENDSSSDEAEPSLYRQGAK